MSNPSICTRLLSYSPPYDWETTLEFFRVHQLPYIESVDDSAYERVFHARRGLGWFRVEKKSREHALLLSVWNGNEEDVVTISKSVRRMFDLDANPEGLLKSMSADGCMTGLWAQHPGLRLARLWSVYESVFTAVLGQLVSVAFGRALTQEFMRAAGSRECHPKTSMPISLFPSAKADTRSGPFQSSDIGHPARHYSIDRSVDRGRHSRPCRSSQHTVAQESVTWHFGSGYLDDGIRGFTGPWGQRCFPLYGLRIEARA